MRKLLNNTKRKKPLILFIKFKNILGVLCVLVIVISFLNFRQNTIIPTYTGFEKKLNIVDFLFAKNDTKNIKWLDFNIPATILTQAYNYDINSFHNDIHLNWIELLAFTSAKNWGKFPAKQSSKTMDDLAVKLSNGENISDLTKDLKLYSFYLEAYSSVLSGFVGEYEVEEKDPNNPDNKVFVRKYGLKVFSPIAKNYGYSHYNDFGVSRTYGYKRKHQGHDLMGSAGTPIIAIEDGYVEVLGWNTYGGWRIGIRSNDKKRYYYYAHLKKDHPYNENLKEGDLVKAGDVIGYLGMTGYSTKENTNNISQPHLHLGLEIIFDESQKDGYNQVWIDLYELVTFLSKNRMPVYKDGNSKDYMRSITINNILVD